MKKFVKAGIRRIAGKFGYDIRRKSAPQPPALWIDVGAHCGQNTFLIAQDNPEVMVYAFEPDWRMASKLMGRSANFVVIPFAVSDANGFAEFFINEADGTSSLLQFNSVAFESAWKNIVGLKTAASVMVPTIRLDTFMELMKLPRIDYLKIDTQGADFMVVKSLGTRIRDVRKIMLEADVMHARLYQGSSGKDEIVSYMQTHGLELTSIASQNHGKEENLTFLRRE
jgi:FkbM family methyltransferase